MLATESHAQTVTTITGIDVEVHGFDAGAGLPPSTHPLDCPFAFQGGEFAMDEDELRGRLDGAQLWIGDVAETTGDFVATDHAPIGFVANDLDYYTSTLASFDCLEVDPADILARVTMYFDDLAGYPYTTANGEWAAIKAFNQRREQRQIGQIYGLRHQIGQYRDDWWVDSMFQLHILDHPDFNRPEQGPVLDLTLEP